MLRGSMIIYRTQLNENNLCRHPQAMVAFVWLLGSDVRAGIA